LEQRNSAIQYLRALAALSVLFYHAAFYLSLVRHDASLLPLFNKFGFFGVALFFAISGHLMGRIAPASNPWRFLSHRIVRIYPLFLILAASVFLFKTWSGNAIAFDPFAFALIPGGPRDYIVGIEWTLPFEIVFYVAIFLAMSFGAAQHLRLIAAAWLVAILVALILPPPTLTYGNAEVFPPLSLLLLSRVSTGFALGLLLPASIDRRLTGWPLLAVAVFFTTAGYFNFRYVFPLMGAAGACLVAMATSREIPFRSVYLEKLGDWSYALYLVHVPVILFVFRVVPAAVPAVATWFFAVVASIAAAIPLGMLDVEIYRRLKRWADSSPVALAAPFLVGFLSAGIYWDIHERAVRNAVSRATTLGAEVSGAVTLTDRLRTKGMQESPDLQGWLDRVVDEPEAGQTLFDGWAIDMAGKDNSPVILIFVNGNFATAAVPVIARPDVMNVLRPSVESATVGFFTRVQTSICKAPSIVKIFIISGERFAELSGTSLKPDCSGHP
jgi:exopolysaccharide production protein ExoZ